MEPESSISSYALVSAADTVLITGSTIGIEAAYAGKPTILAGRAPWDPLGSVHTPATREALLAQVADRDLAALDPHGATMYGYFMSVVGTPYTIYEPTGLMKGTWAGREIRPSGGMRMHARLARWRRSLLGPQPLEKA